MAQGLNFHVLNADRTLTQTTLHLEKLYLIYMGLWLGPQKKKPLKLKKKIINQETLSHYSLVLML
jgi:hypothetical protein